ncbi:MAG: radical SAM protein [Sphingobacterium sp.]|nr:radical SAM protein [Sphingobacterium sp.]
MRLTACDLRCAWCDTPCAFTEGAKRTVADVVDEVVAFGCPLVEITGGEPLLQEDVYPLMAALRAPRPDRAPGDRRAHQRRSRARRRRRGSSTSSARRAASRPATTGRTSTCWRRPTR